MVALNATLQDQIDILRGELKAAMEVGLSGRLALSRDLEHLECRFNEAVESGTKSYNEVNSRLLVLEIAKAEHDILQALPQQMASGRYAANPTPYPHPPGKKVAYYDEDEDCIIAKRGTYEMVPVGTTALVESVAAFRQTLASFIGG